MKKLTLLLVIAFYCFAASAQDIVLTFNAADPEKTIDSIKVTDVESGNSGTVIGETSVDLQAVLTSLNTIQNQESKLTVFPNPFEEDATLAYSINQAEEVTVLLNNSLGQTVVTKKVNLNPGTHRFNVSTANSGIYYVTIHSSKRLQSSKIIALSKGNSCDKIEYVGFENRAIPEKSVLVESGELLHIELSSGNNKTIIADTPTESKTYDVEFYKCEDADSMNYRIVKIGEQWWMAENLAYLPSVSPAFCSYTDTLYYVYDYEGKDVSAAKATENYLIYGALYNWKAAMVACPNGWHLPSDEEWGKLAQFVSDQKGPYNQNIWTDWYELGKHLKASNGWKDDGNGSDDFGFSAIPGGSLDYGGGNYHFEDISTECYFWSSTESSSGSSRSWRKYLRYINSSFYSSTFNKDYGYSVRCVKD